MEDEKFWAEKGHWFVGAKTDISYEKLYQLFKTRFEREDQTGQQVTALEMRIDHLQRDLLALRQRPAPKKATETA